jgi:hypothetical protein
MRFHALRVVCRSCGSSFLFGGGEASDMTFWKGFAASCRVCGAEIDVSDAPIVPLGAAAADAVVRSPRPRAVAQTRLEPVPTVRRAQEFP